MQKIIIEKPGHYDVLKLVEFQTPTLEANQVLIKVHAAGLNYADGIIRMGLYESAKRLHGYPITPGFEIAGEVIGTGSEVRDYRIGDNVIGVTLFGGYTSHIVLDTSHLFRKPENLSYQQAAAIPTVFLTAWFMVHLQVNPRAGDTWLVHSAAGGVGSALVQLGKLAGVRVIGVIGSAHKRDACMAMGADEIIIKSDTDLWQTAERLAPKGFDAIFDANGVSTLGESYRHLAPMGKLCIYGFASMLPNNGRLNWLKLTWDWLRTPRFNPLKMTQENRSVLAANLSFLSEHASMLREGMLWLLEHFSDGRLKPLPVEIFDLADAGKAQAKIESGNTVGKIVLVPHEKQAR